MRKNLILDIEYTLVDIEKIDDKLPIFNYKDSFTINIFENKFIIYRRPYLNYFLIEASKYFNIYSYTSSSSSIFMNSILDQIEKNIGCRIFTGRLFESKIDPFIFDSKSTIIIDDIPENHIKCFYNVVNIPPWISTENDDDKLIETLNFIKTLINVMDIRLYIKTYNENKYPYIYNMEILQKSLNLNMTDLYNILYKL